MSGYSPDIIIPIVIALHMPICYQSQGYKISFMFVITLLYIDCFYNQLFVINYKFKQILMFSAQCSSVSHKQIVNWVRINYPYPNCRKVQAMGDLKSGVPIAQILTQIIPQQYQSMLLSRIQVSNLNSNTCVANWRAIKQVIIIYVNQCKYTSSIGTDISKKIGNITGQSLYYRQQDLTKFMTDILMPLSQINKQIPQGQNKQLKRNHITYSNTIMAHLIQDNQQQQPIDTKQISKFQQSNTKSNAHTNTNTNMNRSAKKDKPTTNTNNNTHSNSNTNYNSQGNVNVSQLSDIANNSYHFIPFSNQKKNSYQNNYNTQFIFNGDDQQQQGYGQINNQQQYQSNNILVPPQCNYLSENLSQWLRTKIDSQCMTQSHQLLGHLVNVIFCSSRLNNYVIKDAHFSHGAIFVYRRLLDFLLTDPLADRVSKNNALNMMKRIQQEGVVRQVQFWKVVQDIYIYDVTKGKKYPHYNHSLQKQNRKNTINKIQKQKQSSLKRKNSRQTLSKCKTSKQSLQTQTHNPTIFDHKIIMADVAEAERWLQADLGFEHTVSKMHSSQQIFTNPLINGTLVGSILMRLKICKPVINKYPNSIEQLRNNWQYINKASTLRGYQIFKKICAILLKHNVSELNSQQKQLTSLFLVILKQFKNQHLKKNPQRKPILTHRTQQKKCNQCHNNYMVKPQQQVISVERKKQLCNWLYKQFTITIDSSYLSVSQVTQICRQVLNVNIYKETTLRIQINNVQKILGELRRIGLSDYYRINKQDIMSTSDSTRWKVIADLKWLIDGKIQFSTP